MITVWQAGGTVYFLEPINSLARQHWRSFSRQNYFDPQGIFLGATVAAPLLTVMFLALVSSLVGADGALPTSGEPYAEKLA